MSTKCAAGKIFGFNSTPSYDFDKLVFKVTTNCAAGKIFEFNTTLS